MQRSSFFATATTTAIVTLGIFGLVPNPGQTQPVLSQPVLSQPAQPQLLANATVGKTGQFVTADHETQGKATIVTENGQRYLEFDSNFRSDNGPDLFVLLHRSNRPNSYRNGEFVRLGRLQSTSGTQRYAIPADVSINDFKSVVIWCRDFNVTFGFAPLG